MSKEFRHILRVAGTDIEGNLKVLYGLGRIRGVNLSLANAIMKKARIDLNRRAGFLTEEEVGRIEEIVKEPKRFGIPTWFMNRRKDLETGDDLHFTGADLDLLTKSDIKRMQGMKSWRGYRHAYGLKVRGQRTRTTGRKGKAVGVRVKKRGP